VKRQEAMRWAWYTNYSKERRIRRHFGVPVSSGNMAAFVMSLLRTGPPSSNVRGR